MTVNIVVTGGMGSGKSMVSVELSRLLGAKLINVDHVCRDMLQLGGKVLKALRKIAPAACFLDDGTLNRPVFRQIIFEDAPFRIQVDGIIHPLLRKEVLHYCNDYRKKNIPLVIEIPLVFEAGWQEDFDYSLLVYADEEICLKRIMQRDLVSKKEALLSIAAQIPIQEKVQLADFLIDNTESFAKTVDQIEYLVENNCFA
jgi:dephospho-CoA kinase